MINEEQDPFFIHVRHDFRTQHASMEFQHFHDFYEVFILMDNTAGYFIEGQYYTINEGDIILLKPGRLHKGVYFDEKTVRRILISFKFPPMEGMTQSMKGLLSLFDTEVPIFRLPLKVALQQISLINDIFIEHGNVKSSEANYYVYSQVLQFLYSLKSAAQNNEYTNQEFDQITHKIYTIANYIHKHYAEALTLEQLSREFFISSCYLSRKFKDVSGYSLIQFIQQTRVKNAQQKLASNKESIKEICDSCGFASFSQFNRIFRKYCETTPSQYRTENRMAK